jgi:hypothetical protein
MKKKKGLPFPTVPARVCLVEIPLSEGTIGSHRGVIHAFELGVINDKELQLEKIYHRHILGKYLLYLLVLGCTLSGIRLTGTGVQKRIKLRVAIA